MTEEILNKYADVVIKVGANIYKNQCLTISTQPETYYFALKLAEKAYKEGAKYVEITTKDLYETKIRLENSQPENLEFIPDYLKAKSNEMSAHDWARINIYNTENIDTLKGQDPTKLQTIEKVSRIAFKRQSELQINGVNQWCIIGVPGPKWAAKTLNTEPTEEAVKKMWEVIIKILRLNSDDPVKVWREHGETLKKRSETLTNMKFDKLRFIGGGTNLEIGLSERNIWRGGPFRKPDGSFFTPNIPTEEIFTTPIRTRTNGKVNVTRPVIVMGEVIEDSWFEFKDGKVINFGSKNGTDLLEKYLNVDEGASYLGEIALVDGKSEIFKSGLLFNNILYDENASCHMAIGFGFPICFDGGEKFKGNDDIKNAGCNVSLVHTDFMIGSPEVDVIGIDKNGKETPIMKNGDFQI